VKILAKGGNMKLQLHRYDRPRSFRSIEHFIAFVDEQLGKYQDLERNSPNDFRFWGNTFQQAWLQAKAHAPNSDKEGSQLNQRLKNNPCIEADSNIADVLRRLTAEKRHDAVNGILKVLKPAEDNQNAGGLTLGGLYGIVEAMVAATLADKIGRTSTGRMLADLIEEHENRMDKLLELDAEKLEEKQSQFGDLFQRSDQRRAQLERLAVDALTQGKADYAEAHREYVEQLKTQTAVELWEARAETHHTKYESFRTWSWRVGAIGGIAGIFWIFLGFALARRIFPNDTAAQIAVYSASSIVLFTLFVWALRVLIRSMISENHLATDASARAAMAHTYLALTKEEPASKEDRAIILASLFAPVSDGLVKDDGMPILSPAALAASAITGTRN
jgi:hypothetical protein